MQKFSVGIIREVLWLILSLVLTGLFAQIILGNTGLDIRLHDTYFVLSPWKALLPLFLFLTFCIYLIKTRFRKFKTNFSYWILIGSGFLLAISLTVLIKVFSQFGSGDWTLYPPLSDLGTNKISNLNTIFLPDLIADLLTVVQIAVLFFTIIVAFRFGRRKQIKNR